MIYLPISPPADHESESVRVNTEGFSLCGRRKKRRAPAIVNILIYANPSVGLELKLFCLRAECVIGMSLQSSAGGIVACRDNIAFLWNFGLDGYPPLNVK